MSNEYIQASIMLSCVNMFAWGTVVSCKHDAEGNIIWHAHNNLILDTCLYDIEFANGKITALMTNAIANAMYAQCDPDGDEYNLLDKHIDVKCTTNALTFDQQQIMIRRTTCQQKSTKDWFICFRWKDSSNSWETLSDLKESHPVQVTKFATHMGFALKPGFNWCVFCVFSRSKT